MKGWEPGKDGYIREILVPGDIRDFPKEFYDSLLEDAADWAASAGIEPQQFNRWLDLEDGFYVLISASILEGMIVDAVSSSFAGTKRDVGDSIRSYVDQLSIQGRTGLLALAESLCVLERTERKVLEGLFSVRNEYAHNPRALGKDIFELFESFEKPKRQTLCAALFSEMSAALGQKDFYDKGLIRWHIRIAPLISMRTLSRAIKKSGVPQ